MFPVVLSLHSVFCVVPDSCCDCLIFGSMNLVSLSSSQEGSLQKKIACSAVCAGSEQFLASLSVFLGASPCSPTLPLGCCRGKVRMKRCGPLPESPQRRKSNGTELGAALAGNCEATRGQAHHLQQVAEADSPTSADGPIGQRARPQRW